MSTEASIPWFDWGVATRALAGQDESGDLHLVQPFPDGVLVAVVDGLGHGPEAAAAARIAVDLLRCAPHEPLVSLVNLCHQRLRETRGVVMGMASFHALGGSMTWIGVGNVEGTLWSASAADRPQSKWLLLRGGVVGGHLPQLRTAILPVTRGDTLIFATDGIRPGFVPDQIAQRANPLPHRIQIRSDPPQQIADRILTAHATTTDDALVLVARYMGGT